MTELAPDLRRALNHVDVEVSVDRTDAMWSGLIVKRRRRVVRRTAGVAALVLFVGGAVFYRNGISDGSKAADRTTPAPTVAHQPDEKQRVDDGLRLLADGSTFVHIGAKTKINVVKNIKTNVAIEVDQGKGRFKVAKRADRTFRVSTSNVRITVYSAEFSVAHMKQQTVVYVERGYLDIEFDGPNGVNRKRRIRGGESATFPETKVGALQPTNPNERVKPPAHKVQTPRTPAQRRLAVSDLLRRADAARSAHRPNDAIKPLTRVVREFSTDPRAGLASFTLGRIYLKELRRPRAAARAFRRVQVLAPAGPLSEDALAREVESWAAAGQTGNARSRAAVYLKRYPNGHRVRAMKKYAE